jgi:hypothetical protein
VWFEPTRDHELPFQPRYLFGPLLRARYRTHIAGDQIMVIHEKLEQLKRQKTAHTTEELDRLGWERYAAIQDELELQHHGDYVMIEVDSGEYFVGETPQAARKLAEAAHPGQAFCLIRVGYKAVHKLKRR